MIFRHGEVIILNMKGESKIPKGAKRLNHLVLAEGEVTGHAHRISQGKAELYEKEGILYLKVLDNEAVLTHEDHDAITLPKGDFEIKIQREYRPGGWNAVKD